MEKNTSKAYVEPTGLVGGAVAPTGEAGSSLFLINLCASMAPVQLSSKTLPGLETYRLYQVTRVEDGRTRYRLRLGFFTTEAEAQEVLQKVRDQYPTAFTACLCEEDRRHMRGYIIKPAAAKPVISVVPSTPAKIPAPAAAAVPVAAKSDAPMPAPAKPAAAKAPTASSAISVKPQLTPPAVAAQVASSVSKTIDNFIALEDLNWDPPALEAKSVAGQTGTTGKHQAIPATFKTQPVIKSEASRATPAPTTPPNASAKAESAKPIVKTPIPPAAKVESKVDTAASMRVRALELTFSDPPAPNAAQTPRAAPNEPFHVAKGIDIPTMQLSLQSEPAALTKAAAVQTPKNTGASPAKSAPSNGPAAAAQINKAVPSAAKPMPTPVAGKATVNAPVVSRHPDLDSTQTIRALTSEELNDDAQEKCFAIQLAASEQPVNLDTMPHLDIFEAYRLYSVAIAGSGKIVHSLRLGFFKEAVSAEAVAGYLKTFFSSPSVLRISVAEQTRFKDALPPSKSSASSDGKANVVELDSARSSRVPTVTMEVLPTSKSDTSATGSFKVNSTGSFRTSETATHRALSSAAKNAAPATKRSAPVTSKKSVPSKTSTTGKYKTASTGKYKILPKKSLAQQLLEEAKEVELSESGIHKLPKNDSLLSRLVDKLKK